MILIVLSLCRNNCPWCHRVVLGRSMHGLEDVISMDTLRYRRDPELGWVFDPSVEGCGPDTAAGGLKAIRELYEREGSAEKSVPVLFDKKTQKIVSNESSEIIRMMGTEFGALAKNKINLYPQHLHAEIDSLNAWIYQEINNGACEST
jgi:glutathionyl-hydroquinone reductase